jgi:uncharacterized membrane protein
VALASRTSLAILVFGAALWCFAIIAAPVFHITSIYQFFSIICHQQSTRSWHIDGEPLAVCVRCASIYFGFLAGLLMLHTPNVRWLKLAIAATAAEWLFALLVMDIPLLRSMSGLLLGGVVAPFVRLGVEQMFARLVHEPM